MLKVNNKEARMTSKVPSPPPLPRIQAQQTQRDFTVHRNIRALATILEKKLMKISEISLLLPRISFFSICDFMTHRTHIGEKGFNCFPKQFVTDDIPVTKINNINSSSIYVLMTQQFLWQLRANLFSLDPFFKNLFLTLVRSITALAIPLFIKGLLLAVRYFFFFQAQISRALMQMSTYRQT